MNAPSGLGADISSREPIAAAGGTSRDFFSRLARQGGPEPYEYEALARWFEVTATAIRTGAVSASEVQAILDAAGDATCSPRTMQGFVRMKPHGYAGDFEVIDRIYQQWLSPDPTLVKWDRFFHAQAAPKAVCNRKAHFVQWLRNHEESLGNESSSIKLLNIGSGPARDVREYFETMPGSRILCMCVDQDTEAIRYAEQTCALYRSRVSFHQGNALRYRPAVAPHLIWSAGLFDYLDNRLFVMLLRRLWRQLAAGGEMVVGNFSRNNPTRGYMEMGGWVLNERSAEELEALAIEAGVLRSAIHIACEPEGVNLFLHLKKPAEHAS